MVNNSTNINKMNYYHISLNTINSGPCLGQAQKYCGVKPVNGIPTFYCIIGSQTTIKMWTNT